MGKNAEQDLKGNSDLLQAVFDSAPNGIAVMQTVYDERGRAEDFSILLFNAYTLNWIGDTEYKGRRYGDVFPMVKETGILKEFIKVAETGVTANFERWYSGEGMKHWFRFTAVRQGEMLVVTTEDITAGKRAEEALRKSEEFTRTALESSPDCVKVLDAEGRLTYMNYNGTCVMEIDDFATVKNKSWWELWPDGSKEDVKDAVAKALSGETAQFQALCPTAKGNLRWWDVVVSPIASADGSVSQLISVSRDITQKRKAEKALIESESRFRALVTASSDVIYSMDADWTTMNPLDGRGFLLDAGAPVKDWMERNVHPAEYETVKKTIAAAIAKKSVFELEHRVLTADGAAGWTFSRATPLLNEQGDIVEWFGAASDITARKTAEQALKESESRFRNVINTTPVGTAVLTGPEMKVEVANEVIVRYWQRDNSVIGKPLTEAIPEIVGQGFPELLARVYNTGIAHIDNAALVYLLNTEGRLVPVYFNYSYTALRETTGTIYGVLIMAIDVTEEILSKKRLEESEARYKILSQTLEDQVNERTKELEEANQTLQDINKELQRSNANLEEFAHAASHDLKEPVRKITFFTHQVKDQLKDHLTEAELRSFNRIENATERMGALIDDLLLYSHVSQRPHEMDSVDLNAKVKRVLEDLELDVQEKAAVVNVGTLPVVKGYRRQLQQLFQNLISNALKYSKADVPPQIEITAEPLEQEGKGYHLIKVTDNGIGFAQEYAEKIFQMFARLHGRGEYGGTGVGLSIVKKVVENHHGHIRVESVPGQGSTFSVLLPVE